MGLAVDPEAGLVGMQGRARQQVFDGGLLPRFERVMEAPDVAEAGRLGEPEAGDRLHQRNGPAQGQHVGDEQVDDKGLQAGAVLQRARHGFGELPLGPGLAVGAFLDLGIHATLDDLEHDVVQDATFPVDGIDAGQVGAAGVAGIDGDRLLDGGLPEVVAREPRLSDRSKATPQASIW